MPLYDYDCSACGRRFEIIHGVHADPPTTCPLCGSGPVRKAIAAPAVHFKGSGWAKKERRTPVKSGGGSSADGGDGDGGAGSDTTPAKDGTAPSTPSKAPAADKNGTSSDSPSTKAGD
jgi:putative FmdB family regulatory protein